MKRACPAVFIRTCRFGLRLFCGGFKAQNKAFSFFSILPLYEGRGGQCVNKRSAVFDLQGIFAVLGGMQENEVAVCIYHGITVTVDGNACVFQEGAKLSGGDPAIAACDFEEGTAVLLRKRFYAP